MTNNPLVSVLIPCYNVSDYVEKAIHSILGQTYSNLEVWLIDDASTDDTLSKLKAIKDSRVKIAEFKNNTCKVGAVNAVLTQISGELITFMDADDWSEPNRIMEQVKQFIQNSDIGICFTSYRFVNKKKNRVGQPPLTDEELKREFLQFWYKKNNESFTPTMCATMMITKEVLEITGGYHPYFTGRVAEDIHWIYRILKDFKGLTVNKPLYNIVYREGSLTQTQFSGKNSKSAYSWHLLSKIIQKDIQENINVLDPQNIEELRKLELAACEEALSESVKALYNTKAMYENSFSFKLGKALLWPFHILKR